MNRRAARVKPDWPWSGSVAGVGVLGMALLLLAFVAHAGVASHAKKTALSSHVGQEKDVPIRVVFINPGKSDETFWTMVSATMTAAAEDLGITLEILYAERDRYRMRELGAAVVGRESPPQYLVLVNEEQVAAEMLQEADRAGIKTFMLLNDFVGSQGEAMGAPRGKYSHWLGSVIPDNQNAGYRMATAAMAAAVKRGLSGRDGKVHLFALAGDRLTPASLARNAGLQHAVAEHSEVVLDRIVFAQWNQKDAKRLTERYLAWAERNSIFPHVVWCANDAIALGAIDALREAGHVPGEDVI